MADAGAGARHRALIRGEYSGPAISAIQHEGVPVDACSTSASFSMGVAALAGRVGDDCNDPAGWARDFMADHKRRYRTYWAWSETVQDHADQSRE
jgi:hypothetical protein